MNFIRKHKWLFLSLILWAIIFGVPAQRILLKAMATGSPWIPFSVFPHDWNSRFGLDAPELPLQVSAIKNREVVSFWPKEIETLNQFDTLIQQHPDTAWLIALRLQVTTIVFKKDRVAGELSDAEIYKNLKSGIPSPETTGEKVNFTPAQMQRTLELCRLGEKLEPQNAFFSWMRARFLLINWQDQKAWQALDEAAHKTYWNNHYYDYLKSYLNASAIALKRPLLPIEKLDDSFINPNFPIHAQTRKMCRIINWEGIKRKRAGQHARALQLWSDLHHVMFLAAQGDSDMISFYVDHSMMAIAQSGATYPSREALKNDGIVEELPPFPTPDQMEKSWKKQLQGFVGYAQLHHEIKIAQQIQDESQRTHHLFRSARAFDKLNVFSFNRFENQFSFSQIDPSVLATSLFVSSVILIVILSGSIILWLFSLGYDYWRADKSTFTTTTPPSPSDSVKRIRICKLAISILGIVMMLYLLGSVSTVTTDSPANIMNFWQMLPVTFHFSFINLVFKWLTFTKYLVNDNTPTPLWRIVFLLVPFIASGIYLLQKYFCRQTHHRGRNVIEGWICVLSFLILASLLPQVYLNRSLDKWAERNIRGEMWEIHHVKNTPPAKR